MEILQQMPQLEALCERLYTAQVRSVRGSTSQSTKIACGRRHCLHMSPRHAWNHLTQNQQERSHVEQTLAVFGQSTDYIVQLKVGPVLSQPGCHRFLCAKPDLSCLCICMPRMQAILDNTASPYAQHMAATNLLKMATENTLRWDIFRVRMGREFSRVCARAPMLAPPQA